MPDRGEMVKVFMMNADIIDVLLDSLCPAFRSSASAAAAPASAGAGRAGDRWSGAAPAPAAAAASARLHSSPVRRAGAGHGSAVRVCAASAGLCARSGSAGRLAGTGAGTAGPTHPLRSGHQVSGTTAAATRPQGPALSEAGCVSQAGVTSSH